MDNIYAIADFPACLSEQKELSTRRIFHGLERRYLTAEAQSMASCLLNSLSVSPDVTENAIQQAVVLGTLSGAAVDIQTFEALFHAVALDPLFKIPFSAVNFLGGCNLWVC